MPKKTTEEIIKNHLKMIAKERFKCANCGTTFRYKLNYIEHCKKCYPYQVHRNI